MTSRRRIRLTAWSSVAVIAAMVGLTAASVPLYRLFCEVTGYGGTTRVATEASGTHGDSAVIVRFDADVDRKLPWRFAPAQAQLVVPLGEDRLAFYEAVNDDVGPVVGRAVYNVTPHKVGSYFAKIACFCFEEQVLEAGQRVEMPVSFFVDPAVRDDVDTREVKEITLSYTFFIDERATAELRRKRQDQPSS